MRYRRRRTADRRHIGPKFNGRPKTGPCQNKMRYGKY